MKKICSSCGNPFEGVVCTNCGGGHDRTTVITVSRPVPVSETTPREMPDAMRALEKSREKARRADERVRRLENAEAKRKKRAEKREKRLTASEQSSSKISKLFAQLAHVMSLSVSGATRQAIHFVISPRGSLAFILLIPICALIPVFTAIIAVLYSGLDTSPELITAVGDVLSAAMPTILKAMLLWLELSFTLVLYLRALSFVIGGAITFRRATGLVCVAQLHVLFLLPLAAVCLFIIPALSLLIAAVAAFQLVIMLFVGTEFSAMDKKRGVFAAFSVMLGAYICTLTVIIAINIPSAAEYIRAVLYFLS